VDAIAHDDVPVFTVHGKPSIEDAADAIAAFAADHAAAVPCSREQARAIAKAMVHRPRGAPAVVRGGPADAAAPGERLRTAREVLGLSQTDLAQLAGMSNSMISYVEAGRRPLRRPVAVVLAEALTLAGAAADVEWILHGSQAQSSQRIADLLALAEYALVRGDLTDAEQRVEQIASADLGRPLVREEHERTAAVRAAILLHRGRTREAVDLLAPIVRRAVAEPSSPRLVTLGASYVQGLLELSRGAGRLDLAGAAALAGEDVLAVTTPDPTWWHLATTTLEAHIELGQVHQAVSLGETWLATVVRDSDRRHAAGLAWHLADLYASLGNTESALVTITMARDWHDDAASPQLAARVRLAHAQILLRAHPDRVETAIAELEACQPDLWRLADASAQRDWTYCRARADVIHGELPHALDRLAPLLHDPAATDPVLVLAQLMAGDIHYELDRRDAARHSYDEAARLLHTAPKSRDTAQRWSDLADRLRQLGATEAASDALRMALESLDLPSGPLLPPYQADQPARAGRGLHPATRDPRSSPTDAVRQHRDPANPTAVAGAPAHMPAHPGRNVTA
jgi:transcriptional regulator with XRE-family HTH domain